MSVEKPRSKPQKIDTKSYFLGFIRPDVQVVADMASYIDRTKQEINKVIVHRLDGIQKNEAIVYVEEIDPKSPIWTEVDWFAPGSTPQDYDDYAYDFYDFTGDYETQLHRAKLLGEVLQKPVKEITEIPEHALRIPSLGVIIINNPLKDPNYRWSIGMSSHQKKE